MLGSLFDPDYYRAEQQAIFLETLSNQISRPIRPHEAELEYLTTQLVAEYLGVEWDGMIFSSSQTAVPSKNVVLFNKASKVSFIDKDQYYKIDVKLFEYDEDSLNFSPSVTKLGFESATPSIKKSGDKYSHNAFILSGNNCDERDDILEIADENLTVEIIKGVDYKSESHAVTNYCFVYSDDEMGF